MKTNSSKSRRAAAGTLIIIGALGTLLFSSMKSSALRAVPVGEICRADSTPNSFVGQNLRLVGFVGKEPVRRERLSTPSGPIMVNHFVVVEKNQRVQVAFRDTLPDTFRPGSPVQVDGNYHAAGQMTADRVLTKCPSKYEAGEAGSESGGDYKSGDKATKTKTESAAIGANDQAAM